MTYRASSALGLGPRKHRDKNLFEVDPMRVAARYLVEGDAVPAFTTQS
jgi:hypothetical protein